MAAGETARFVIIFEGLWSPRERWLKRQGGYWVRNEFGSDPQADSTGAAQAAPGAAAVIAIGTCATWGDISVLQPLHELAGGLPG